MSQVVFKARNRKSNGSGEARRIRRSGMIPGVLYGRAGKAVSIELDTKDFINGIKTISDTTIVKVDVDGKAYEAFVKDTQRNIQNNEILHVDFYEVESGVILRAKVTIQLKGQPVGVREGGILETPLHEVEVECLPKDLPERISLDISKLGANHSIHVRDLSLGDGIKILSNPEQVIALVKFKREEVPAAAAATTTDAAAAPESDTKDKEAAADKEAK